jgi:CysZ protein
MNFINQVYLGVSTYKEAHRLIFKHKLWWYILAPGIINCILFLLTFAWLNALAKTWATALLSNANEWMPTWLSLQSDIVTWLIALVIKLGFLIVYLSVYKYVILILMSPLLALLSERVERIITGKVSQFNLQQFIADVVRGMLLAMRNFLIEITLLAILFVCSFIPLLQLASPVLAFYISSYYYGFSMLDYSNERRQYSIARSIRFTRLQKGVAFGNGGVFYILLLFPVFGWLIAPAYAVTAAAIARLQLADVY